MTLERFKLADSDLVSSTWAKLNRRIEERLQELRTQNDNPALDAVATAMQRGRIAELRLLLTAAEKDLPPIDLG